MANLKSYSCPTCGSFLEVDRDRDVFDCPFCGSHFDAVSFHGTDLYEQARTLLKAKNYKQAREKYAYLLNQRPESFELLYSYACAVGEVSSLDVFEDPIKYSSKLLVLFTNDKRYKQGPAAPYFAKLAELFTISSQCNELRSKQTKMRKEANDAIDLIDKEKNGGGCGIAVYLTLHYTVGLLFIGALEKSTDPIWLCIYLFLPVVVLVIWNARKGVANDKVELERSERRKPHYDKLAEADALTDQILALTTAHIEGYEEIPALKTKAGSFIPEIFEDITGKKSSAPAIISKNSFINSQGSDDTVEVPESAVCSKCGAGLTLDKERKLFICSHCGVSYDYALFVGDPNTKAVADLKNRDFDLADKRFAKILEASPDNFDANRGRILCACKWIAFTEGKLDTGYSDVDWEAFDNAVNAAISNTTGMNQIYFKDIKTLIETGKEYHQVCQKLEDKSLSMWDRDDFKESRDSLVRKYNDKMRVVLDKDRNLRAVVSGTLNSEPDMMLEFRNRILRNGSWKSVEKITPSKQLDSNQYLIIRTNVEEAIVNSAAPYKAYFKRWKDFLDILEQYSRFLVPYRKLKNCEEDSEERRKELRLYAVKDEGLRREFDQKHKDLIKSDNELFSSNTDIEEK